MIIRKNFFARDEKMAECQKRKVLDNLVWDWRINKERHNDSDWTVELELLNPKDKKDETNWNQ